MKHVAEATLRRLLDEPFAVADHEIRHVSSCARCQAHKSRIEDDSRFAHRFITVPIRHSDADTALTRMHAARPRAVHDTSRVRTTQRHRVHVMGLSLGTGATFATIGVLVAGVAAAATLTTVFSPTKVAPLPLSTGEIQPIAHLLGIDRADLTGFQSASGHEATRFGVITWRSRGTTEVVSSLAAAENASGLRIGLPATLPSGVGEAKSFAVVPRTVVTVTFDSRAGKALSGSTLNVTIGPAVGVEYSGPASASQVSPLAIAVMASPTATSDGATTGQLEQFLFAQPEIPANVKKDLRALGNLQSTLPVPTPSGTTSSPVKIDGSPGLLVTEDAQVLSGAIWESHGEVHVVAGILDTKDVLDVARQVG